MLAACLLLALVEKGMQIDAARVGPDVDGDGLRELVVWTRNDQVFISPRNFEARVAPLPGLPGRAAESVRTGDLDGDWVADWLGCLPRAASAQGLVRAFSERSGKELYTLHGASPGCGFGSSTAALGDLDGDGCIDFAIGAPGAEISTDPVRLFGAVHWFSGGTGKELRVVYGASVLPTAVEGFGGTVAGGQDFDRDGKLDLLISEGVDSNPHGHPQCIAILSGADGHLIGNIPRPEDSCSVFAASLAAIPDVNGDSVPDVVAGSPHVQRPSWTEESRFDRSLGPGRVDLFSGKDGALLHTWEGEPFESQLGKWVFAAGDVDGDGACDIWILEPGRWRSDYEARLHLVSPRTFQSLRDEPLRLLLDRVPR
jgi:hypothetical protein